MVSKNKQANTRKKTTTKTNTAANADGLYLLKLVMYTILGTQWLWIETGSGQTVPLPIGLLLGLLFAMHEHFQVDRKIEYAVLLAAMLAGFIAHVGILITV